MEIIRIGNRRFAIGLEWVMAESGRPSRKTIQYYADQVLQGDHFAVRRHGPPQIGVGTAATGNTSRAYALAPNLSVLKPEPWLGIYHLGGDLWWYIAVRDGQSVLPQGDVVGTHSDVLAAQERDAADYEDWEYVEGTLVDLEEMARQFTRLDARVRPVHSRFTKRRIATLGVAGLVVGGAVFGGLRYYHYRQVQAEAARLAAIRAKIAAMQRQADAQAHHVILPWVEKPAPADFFHHCQQLFSQLAYSEDGWLLSNWRCGETQVEARYERAPGASARFAPPGRLGADGESITRTQVFSALDGDKRGILPREPGVRALYGLAQSLNWQIRVLPTQSPTTALPGAQAKTPAETVPWAVYDVDITFQAPPFGSANVLDALRGLRLETLQVTFQDDLTQNWTAKGVFYVQK